MHPSAWRTVRKCIQAVCNITTVDAAGLVTMATKNAWKGNVKCNLGWMVRNLVIIHLIKEVTGK